MTIRYVSLPLYEDSYYSYSINLEGNSYKFKFIYNEKMALYTINMFDVDDNAIVLGVGLVPNYTLFADYSIPALTGTFVLLPKSQVPMEFYKLYPDKIHQYYELSYIYDDAT